MTSVFSQLRSNRDGTTAIEFAMIVPVFVVMIIATLVFGHTF